MGKPCLLYHLLLGESLFLNYLLMTYLVRMGTERGFNFKQGRLDLKAQTHHSIQELLPYQWSFSITYIVSLLLYCCFFPKEQDFIQWMRNCGRLTRIWEKITARQPILRPLVEMSWLVVFRLRYYNKNNWHKEVGLLIPCSKSPPSLAWIIAVTSQMPLQTCPRSLQKLLGQIDTLNT